MTEILKTRIHNLDFLLGGGLLSGRVYLIEGPAGSGKTILGNQIAFNVSTAECPSLFVTLLSESHGKMLEHIEAFKFYNHDKVGKDIHYLSGYSELTKNGLKGFKEFLVKSIRLYKSKLLIIDGFRITRNFSRDFLEYSNFIHELSTLMSTLDCTLVMLNPSNEKDSEAEHFLVDGLIEVKRFEIGMREIREIQIHKTRGMAPCEGRHAMRISENGILIFPRAEKLIKLEKQDAELSDKKLTFDISALDKMLHGGLLSGSMTIIVGPPGSGKTILGLNFLKSGLKNSEKALYFGFYETQSQLLTKADGIGLDLKPSLESGQLRFEWYSPTEQLIDELYEKIMTAIEVHKPNRIFIDGIDGFRISSIFPDRLPRFITALTVKLRSQGITCLFSQEEGLINKETNLPAGEYSAAFENIIRLRYMESKSQVNRIINIIKTRASDYEPFIHLLKMSKSGVQISTELL